MSVKYVQVEGASSFYNTFRAQGTTLGDGYTLMKCYYLRS